MTDLSNTVMVITGAAGTLGAAVAEACEAAGATTALVDRAPDRLRQTRDAGATRLLLEGVDLTSEGAARDMVTAVMDRFDRIDALVHTVGGFHGGDTVQEDDLSTWDAMMSLNLRTAVIACRAVLPTMRDQGGGAIVTVSAGAALSGRAGLAAYGASKAALLRLTESLSEEVKAEGIRVNAVLPSIIDTARNRQAMPNADRSTWVAPDAIAAVIAFLVSDAARAVTGVALPVTGRG
ncbi:SDR family NAD(P)-dependent oxidoreductase [Roseospira visakhapatnamensis]|uniref:NAD(P)-dependent dehydrogenase (Short-subunit alcohol dehydrogenase family) n=1 Tax=Roseospira visakhapatnamensis TaxID=390880 RepID=A0A7W6RDN7_9PROT|nr:SDR family NAD(P)-dependent oxidoreductase [Roseospira visakhapatnamensis]MBB4266412.1 NAD(P)-dependent dehydrogenase (short-subunit alcohol dehydrogenase family) [Roseospira visakhapatnamensis]